MIKIALVDDQNDCAQHFKNLVARYMEDSKEEIKLYRFDNGFDFLETYKGDYDVIFLDIEMPLIDGLEVAKKLREIDAAVPLIFVTVMAQLAIKGYEISAMDFIVKPITYFNFKMKVEKAIALRSKIAPLKLNLLDNEGVKFIDKFLFSLFKFVGGNGNVIAVSAVADFIVH